MVGQNIIILYGSSFLVSVPCHLVAIYRRLMLVNHSSVPSPHSRQQQHLFNQKSFAVSDVSIKVSVCMQVSVQ